MSGSNALAAAKRRRGGSLPDNRPIQRPGQVQVNSVVSRSGQQAQQTTGTSSAPTQPLSIPAPPGWALPPNVNPLQIITVHHTELGRMMVEFPETFEELGNSFNSLSANYDNLNERVIELETNSSVVAFNDLDAKLKSETDRSFDAMATLKIATLEMQKNTIDNGNRMILLNDVISDLKTRMNVYDSLFNDINSKIAAITERFDAFSRDVEVRSTAASSVVASLEHAISRLTSMPVVYQPATPMSEPVVDSQVYTEPMDMPMEQSDISSIEPVAETETMEMVVNELESVIEETTAEESMESSSMTANDASTNVDQPVVKTPYRKGRK